MMGSPRCRTSRETAASASAAQRPGGVQPPVETDTGDRLGQDPRGAAAHECDVVRTGELAPQLGCAVAATDHMDAFGGMSVGL
jgi:hypothetical protein